MISYKTGTELTPSILLLKAAYILNHGCAIQENAGDWIKKDIFAINAEMRQRGAARNENLPIPLRGLEGWAEEENQLVHTTTSQRYRFIVRKDVAWIEVCAPNNKMIAVVTITNAELHFDEYEENALLERPDRFALLFRILGDYTLSTMGEELLSLQQETRLRYINAACDIEQRYFPSQPMRVSCRNEESEATE
jgi:hypothetical protein